jgi:hypothetical protein
VDFREICCENEIKYYKKHKCLPSVNLYDKYILLALFNNFMCYRSIVQTMKQVFLEPGGCGFQPSYSDIFYCIYL